MGVQEEQMMQPLGLMLAIAVGLAFPLTASAQSASQSDLAYCKALSDLYMRYIGRDESSPGERGQKSAEGNIAVMQCRQGNAAASIPVLEKKLTNNRFTLPPRS
jgi:hypothetical protein